jgi:hypothetical protein
VRHITWQVVCRLVLEGREGSRKQRREYSIGPTDSESVGDDVPWKHRGLWSCGTVWRTDWGTMENGFQCTDREDDWRALPEREARKWLAAQRARGLAEGFAIVEDKTDAPQ